MSEPSSHKPAPPTRGSSVQPRASSSVAPSSSVRPPVDGQTVISSRPPTPPLDLVGQVPLESGSLWEGEQLGQFVLQKFVGGGGMGIVFRALDTTLDREVAVKVLSRDQSADEETLRRFRNEAQSAARLNHDNIARVFYVGEDRGVHYIVFEFIEGVNIRDLVEHQGPLPLDQALSYTYQIAQALDHASQRSVIHRDIKPSNVLVTPDGKAKLVDMGLARMSLMAQASNDLTASGVTLGTFDYISPEQARDPRSADVRSDLYSLGCSFFFMLTGRPPFPEGTVLQKLLQHQADTPPDLRSLRPDLPLQVSRVLARLLAKSPTDRFQSPADLIAELSSLAAGLGLQLSEVRPPRPATRTETPVARWAHHLPWAVPLAALLVVVLGLDVYWRNTLPAASDAAWNVPARRLPPATKPPVAPEVLIPEPSLREPAPAEFSPPPPQPDEIPPRGEVEATPATAPAEALPPGGFTEQFMNVFKGLKAQFDERPSPSSEPVPLGTSRSTSDELDLSSDLDPPPAPPDARPMPPASLAGVLTVGEGSGPQNYTSLHAAASAAKDGDTIELRYNGRRTERPFAIANIRLTVRAASGFRPIVTFAPDPEKPYTRPEMVSIAGGALLASDIHWELDLPPNSPAVRALFETQRADLLDFQRCTFTIRGQPLYHAGVAFFDIQAPPGSNSMGMGGTAMEAHVVSINLRNCVARGEATLLRDAELQSVRLSWENGLLATSERLLLAEGDSNQPRQEPRAEIVLENVTAVVGAGLVLSTNSQEAPYQLLTDLHVNDCVIATGNSAPLVEQRGSASIEEFESRLHWHGNSVQFHGFNVFWQIMSSSSATPSKQFDFAQWQDRWRYDSADLVATGDAAAFSSLAAGGRPHHEHTPDDYAQAVSRNATTNSEGGAAGSLWPYLPVPPRGTSSMAYPTSVGPFTRTPSGE